jgi:hypothetical protein
MTLVSSSTSDLSDDTSILNNGESFHSIYKVKTASKPQTDLELEQEDLD